MNHVTKAEDGRTLGVLWRIYTRETVPGGESFWKFLCWVSTREALGLLERVLTQAEIDYKVFRDSRV